MTSRKRRLTAAAALLLLVLPACAAEAGAALGGATWVLDLPEEWGDTPDALTPTEVTLEFLPGDGTIAGTFAYQKYIGIYTVDGSAISFDKLAWTTLCCMAAAGTLSREQAYLFALEDAQSYAVEGDTLSIDCGEQVLVFGKK